MSLWVLGTDTGVGKTVISALILNRYGSGGGLAYWKPVSTGGESDRDRTTISHLLEPEVAVLDETYLFELSASPHLAARVAGAEIEPDRILQAPAVRSLKCSGLSPGRASQQIAGPAARRASANSPTLPSSPTPSLHPSSRHPWRNPCAPETGSPLRTLTGDWAA